MSNYVGGEFIPPHKDPYYSGDQVMDPAEILGGPVHTQMWRKSKHGQMQRITFPQVPYREYPKTMYGIGVDPLAVHSEEEEMKALELGYVDHPTKLPQYEDQMEIEGMDLEVSAIRGNISKNGKRLGRPPKNQYPD